MQEVALRAGVAPSSVSRVLSDHPNVSAVMRHRVLDAVAALGYEPDLLAQALRRGATMTVGFAVGNISNPVLAEITFGAETHLRQAGYSMLLTNSMGQPDSDAENIRLLAQRRVDGMLISLSSEEWPSTIEAVKRAMLPVVLVERDLRVERRASAVLSDHEIGIDSAVRHLASFGHKRVALVNGPIEVLPARARAAALRKVAKLMDMESTVRSGEFSSEHGERATKSLLAQSDRPTAILAGSNQILVGVLRAIRKEGLKVPEDLSLVTCDEIPLAEFLDPPLATIERNRFEMGTIAATLLLELFSGSKPRGQRVPTTYIPTASVGPAPLHLRTS